MINDINKTICDTIYAAIEKKNITSNKDITYLCTVTQIYPENANTYQLTYEDTDYTVTLNNITLNLYDEVHLVIPQGDFSKKYVLEDVCCNYMTGSGKPYALATPAKQGLMSAADKKKLDGIDKNSQANIQADWNDTDSDSDAFIKNKPESMPASDVYAWAKSATKPEYTKSEIGLGNVPDVTTNDQTPTFTEKKTRENITSGDTLSVLFGKIKKFFSDLKDVAFSGSYNDLSDKPTIPSVGNGIVTVKQNGTIKGQFAMNQSENTEIELTDNNTDTTYSDATTSKHGLMTASDKKKLNGIAENANNYSLPAATSSTRGGVKTGYSANGKNYPVQLDNERMYVNVPWTDTNTDTWIANSASSDGYVASSDGQANKVWKTDNEGNPGWMDDEDTTYSDATTSKHGLMAASDKTKLDGIAANANNYSLPAATSSTRGGVKTGYSANGKNYPVQLSNERMYVNVPWTDTNTNTWKANSSTSEGYVASGSGQANKVWKTDKDGTPGWRDDENTTYTAGKQLSLENNEFNLTTVEITDWNEAVDTGFYVSKGNAENSPATLNFFGIVINNGDYVLQMLYNYKDEDFESMQICFTRKGKPVGNGYVWLPFIDQTIQQNSKDYNGFVTKGDGNPNKVWKTDEYGNPSWMDDTNTQTVTGVKGNTESTYRTGNINLTPENIGAVNKSGDTMNGELTLRSGSIVSKQGGISGTDGYIKIAKISITSAYINYPIVFEIAGRGWNFSRKLYVYFNSVSTTSPTLNSFYIDNTPPFKVVIAQSNASVWDIYMKKNEAYGRCDICSLHKLPTGVSVTFPNEQVSTLPNETKEPTVITWDKAKDADTVDGKHASDLQNYNNLTNKPEIPSVGNGTVTIIQAGTSKGSFTMNQSGDTTIELTDTDTNTWKPNSSTSEGYVASGRDQANKVWKTDKYGNPGWRDDEDTTYSDATTSKHGLMTASDKTKLDGIAANANNYSLPAATSSTRGGVKTGYSENGKNYPVQLDNEQMYVNVPWTDTNTDTWIANSSSSDGYVASGNGQANKVWKTDAYGNPGWRPENNSLSDEDIFKVVTGTTSADIVKTIGTMPSHYNVMNGDIGIDSSAGSFYTVLNLGTYAGSGGADRTQMAFPYQESLDDTDMFIRTAKGKVWRTWRKLLHDGNIDKQTLTFTQAEKRENIVSGEKISTLLGKIKKVFTDLKTVAFTGSYNDLSNKPSIPEITFGTISQLITYTGTILPPSFTVRVKIGTHYLYHTHIEAEGMYITTTNKWIDVFGVTTVPYTCSYGIIRISDTGQLIEGMERANVRFYGGKIQLALPKAIQSSYLVSIDLYAHV